MKIIEQDLNKAGYNGSEEISSNGKEICKIKLIEPNENELQTIVDFINGKELNKSCFSIIEENGAYYSIVKDKTEKNTYHKKRLDRWDVMLNFGSDWECYETEYTLKDAEREAREYKENLNIPVKIKKYNGSERRA